MVAKPVLASPIDASGNPIGSLQRPSLRDAVRQRLEQAILRGHFVGGQRINELELAQQWGVSRGLLREAIRELEAEGLLVSSPYRGTFVKEWSVKNITELYTLRSRLEEFAVELASARRTDADLLALGDTMQCMYRAAEAGDAMGLVELDLQFHRQIYAIAGHELLLKMLHNLSGQTHLFIMATKAVYSVFPTLADAAGSHEEVFHAIRMQDPEHAREAIRTHICDAGRLLIEKLASDSQTI